jgi:soluble lytic murein transglycosylase-like protein
MLSRFLAGCLAGLSLSLSAAASASPIGDCDSFARLDGEEAYRQALTYLPGDPRSAAAWLHVAALKRAPEALRLLALVPRHYAHALPGCEGATSDPRPQAVPANIAAMVARLAPEYGLDPALVNAVIQVESGFHVRVVSPRAAAGLMQLIPATAARFGVTDVFDPEQNIRGGMAYLRWLLSYYRGNLELTLAGYNAGEGAVDRNGGVPPYRETTSYVSTVRRLYPGSPTHDPAIARPSPLVR